MQDEGLVRLVAVCDVDEAALAGAAAEFGAAHTTDYRRLLERDEVEVVDVCTPNYLHMQPVLDAFAAGKHVFCEKPLAMDAAQGARMVAAGRAAGRQLGVGLNLRFAAGPQAVKRFVDDGRLGRVYYARAHALRRRGIPGWGTFTQKDKQGGGPLIDIGVHILDLTLWLMGFPEPVSVTGQTYAEFGPREGVVGLLGPWDPKAFTVEDFAAGFVRLAGGATLSLESSFAANIAAPQFHTSLMGTEGGAYLEPNNDAATRLFREESGALTDTGLPFLPTVHTYDAELRAFIEAVRDGAPVPVPGEQALAVTRILDALYRSAETGREVLM
jgi:predicted dehydrogenase